MAHIALAADTWLDFELDWLSADEAQRCLDAVRAEVTWVEREIVLYGKRIMQPRLVGWAGDVGYRYSGQTLEPRPFTDTVFRHGIPREPRVTDERVSLTFRRVRTQ